MSTTADTMTGRHLYRDQRGAVMITGLFMSLFLIGSLWYVMGIGDAVVFRDRMQEAADHAAFSDVALHAKGMNFIVVCNLIMLVATVVHIIKGLISDVKLIKLAACIAKLWIASIIGCWGPAFDWWNAYSSWKSYFSKMKPVMKNVHTVARVASYAYPALGVASAYTVGRSYGKGQGIPGNDKRTSDVKVVALSTSMIPGSGEDNSPTTNGKFQAILRVKGPTDPWGVINAMMRPPALFNVEFKITPASSNTNGKEGLPVQAAAYRELCKKIGPLVGNTLKAMFGTTGGGGDLGSSFSSLIAQGLHVRYCMPVGLDWLPPFGPGFSEFWKENGPYHVYRPAKNGNMWFQTWALNVSPTLTDDNESRVHIATAAQAWIPTKYSKEEKASAYFSQAEFYFDCKQNWDDSSCNGDDMAMYAIKWRARMRRFDISNLLSGAVGGALEALTNTKSYAKIKEKALGPIFDKLETATGIGSYFTKAVFKEYIDDWVKMGEAWGKDKIIDMTPSGADGPTVPGVYH